MKLPADSGHILTYVQKGVNILSLNVLTTDKGTNLGMQLCRYLILYMYIRSYAKP